MPQDAKGGKAKRFGIIYDWIADLGSSIDVNVHKVTIAPRSKGEKRIWRRSPHRGKRHHGV